MIKLLILVLVALMICVGAVFVSQKPGEDGCAGLIFFGLAAIIFIYLLFGNY